jgi:2-haloacid dehalogenase
MTTKNNGAFAMKGRDNRPLRPEVLFFDSNESMLDLSGMKPQVTEAFDGREDLMALWFSTMLYHSLVDTVTSNYHDFGTIGAACMQMVAEGHGIRLDKKKAGKAMAAMKTIPAHLDVPIGNCMLIAAHGWDVTGATLAGMRAAFIERPGKTLYPLGPDVEFSAFDMEAVAERLVAMPK